MTAAIVDLEPRCESPIEAAMYRALSDVFLLDVEPQHTVRLWSARRKKYCAYRIDLAVFAGPLRIAVECDGHAFHERTKEQVRRDRARERTLILDGWIVLRFTGSEIHANVNDCAGDVYSLIVGEAMRAFACECPVAHVSDEVFRALSEPELSALYERLAVRVLEEGRFVSRWLHGRPETHADLPYLPGDVR